MNGNTANMLTLFLSLGFSIEGNVSSLVIPYYENMDVMNYLRSNPTADKLLLVSKLPDIPVISVDIRVTDHGFGFWYCLFTRPRDDTW